MALLLTEGANVHAVDEQGRTALQLAVQGQCAHSTRVAAALLAFGARFEGRLKSVSTRTKYGPILNVATTPGWGPLRICAAGRLPWLARQLLRAGMDDPDRYHFGTVAATAVSVRVADVLLV